MPKSRRSSMQQAMLNMNKHIYSNEVRLMMECTEEELLPCQRLSYKSALDEYSRVNKYIADVQNGKIQMTNVPNSTISLVTDPNAVVRPKQASKANNDPDVIVIGESPAHQMKGGQTIPALPNVNNITLPTLPDNISGQQIITFPQQVFNQFVNGQQSNVVKVGNQIFIRPIMPVAPQQNGAQGVSYSVNTQSMVRPTSLLKRQADIDADKKRLLTSKNEMDSSGNWVPLDEFYYGKKEGDPTYVEDKGEYRFKCWYCSKMLYNNVKIMMHMQGHIDSEKQHNLDLSDLTQCKHCYKQFDTPFEMQTHIEKVHMYNSNVLMCRICEKDCDSRFTLTSHMRTNHNACEMPYICHLCGFRSSMYSDVVDHFKKKHDSSANLLCLYCLKAFNIKFISTGWGQTQNYYHHLLKHQAKNKVKKCQVCKLTFFNPGELKLHRQKDHLANVKGVIGMNSKYTTPDQVMIKVPEQGLQPKPIKSLNAPTVSKVRDNHLLLPRVVNDVDCLECKTSMSSVEHFKKYIQCSMCRFATSCSFAYANHMMGFHSGKMTTLSLNIPQEKPMDHVMYCMCGYASLYGNKIANHMVHCTKRTCYKDKPDVQIQEYDNKEMQDPRKKPGASLLDVLGLVKKPSSGEGDDINESNEDIEGIDDKPKEDSSSNDSQKMKSSTTDASEVKEKSEEENDDVVEIMDDEPSADDDTDKNSAKSNEEKTNSNKDDGGGEDVISKKMFSAATDNVKNNSEDITDVISHDSLKVSQKDRASEIKKSESPDLNDEQSGNSNVIKEVNSEEKKSTDDQSIDDDSEVQMEIPADQSTTEDKDPPVIESITLDPPVPSSEEDRKPENDSVTKEQKAATSSTPSSTSTPMSDDKESTSEDPKDMPDAVIAMETEDTPSSDNVDTTVSNTDKETESSTIAEEKLTDNVDTTVSNTDKETESSTIAEEKSTDTTVSNTDKETEYSTFAEEKFTDNVDTTVSNTDKENESSTIAEEKSTEETFESKDVSPSEVPLNEASTHSSGTSADKEENIALTSDQTNTKTSSHDETMDQKSTEPDVADTPDKPLINEASLETNPEESLQTKESSIKSLNENEIKGETPTDQNIEKDTTQVDSAIQSSEEQPSEGSCPGTARTQHPVGDPTKRQEHSESSSPQPNEPPQQQNQIVTSAESSSKPDNSNRRNDDGHRQYSEGHSRAYDRDRSNREHRDRDRSYQHRNDYRDRSRDNHSDRDRKYDRDYDRHDRDRNRDYGYHGSHSRDNRRDGYRDRDRDYDNRNKNRKGGNYRDRSSYY